MGHKLRVSDRVILDDSELQEQFVRAPGPGGQNVNKVATAVQLRWDLLRSPSVPDDVRERLRRLAGRRLSADGVLIIEAHRFRSQAGNRASGGSSRSGCAARSSAGGRCATRIDPFGLEPKAERRGRGGKSEDAEKTRVERRDAERTRFHRLSDGDRLTFTAGNREGRGGTTRNDVAGRTSLAMEADGAAFPAPLPFGAVRLRLSAKIRLPPRPRFFPPRPPRSCFRVEG
jgi:ribosome-associated protein